MYKHSKCFNDNGKQKDHWKFKFGLELELKGLLWHTKLQHLGITSFNGEEILDLILLRVLIAICQKL